MALDRTEYPVDTFKHGSSTGITIPKPICNEYPLFDAERPLDLKVVDDGDLRIELRPHREK